MKTPDTPHNEALRLRALRSLNILDTPPEARFDRLTRLAKSIFNVPIALISLIDEDRQWFKSCIGLEARETTREISFCGHAILGDSVFIIEDASQDERFADNPLVLNDPKIRFYAGWPLRHVDGSNLGTLCIIDTVPRVLRADELDTLRDLAEVAEAELVAMHLATLDHLTKVMNRRGFITLAENSLSICIRQKLPASLAFFDLKGFKAINDQFGHAEGDLALATFAQQMTKVFRDSDIVARFGGDEFVVLLIDASVDLTKEIIARFRRSLEAYNDTADRGYRISFSDGVVAMDPARDYSIQTLLSQADTLMYEAKRKRAVRRAEQPAASPHGN